uniref:Uncharacterized protein n=1 Tax=Oryza meridionalis TaxID=40149 RepID=A0A0E0EW71_9ORYZ
MRKLCTEELLTPRRLAGLYAVREEAARELVRRVSDASAGDAPVAVAREAFAALRDIVEEAVVVTGAPNLSDYFPVIAAADVMGVRRRMEKLVGWVYGVIDVQIERRRRRRIAGEPRKNVLLDVALDMEGEVEGEGWVMNQHYYRKPHRDRHYRCRNS